MKVTIRLQSRTRLQRLLDRVCNSKQSENKSDQQIRSFRLITQHEKQATVDTFAKDSVAQEGREDLNLQEEKQGQGETHVGIRRVGRRQKENEGGRAEAGRTGLKTKKTENTKRQICTGDRP